jgi:uncharacterized protein (DUF2147 family)
MKRILAKAALLALAASVPVTASAKAALEGQWRNPKGSVVVKVEQCGKAFCGIVVRASEKAQANARRGGTANLIGTRILSGLKPVGEGRYKGKVFVPKRNLYASATVRQVSPNIMEVEGCALAGILCDEQRWTRVGG